MKMLKELREKEKLTQAKLGKIVGVSGRSVGFYETGERIPKLEVAIKIANFFKKSVIEVFPEISKMNQHTKD